VKLGREYFAEHRNLKHFPVSPLSLLIDRECKKVFGTNPKTGNLFAVESEFDSRLYAKINNSITDWQKDGANVWFSTFNGVLKIYDVRTNTKIIIYRK